MRKRSLVAVGRGKRGGEAPGLLADALGARRVDGGNGPPEQAFRHGRRQAAEAGAQRPWQAAGGAPHAVKPAVFRIAAEQFVAAIARERDGDVLSRRAGDEIGRQLRGVRERLVEPVGHLGNEVERGGRLEHHLGMIGPEMTRHHRAHGPTRRRSRRGSRW